MRPPFRSRKVLVLALCAVLGIVSTVGIAWFHAATQDMFEDDRFTALDRPKGVTDGPDLIWIRQQTHHASIGWTVSYELGVVRNVQIQSANGPPLTVARWARELVYPWETESDKWPAFAAPRLPYAIQAVHVRAHGWPWPALYSVLAVKDTGATPFVWGTQGAVVVPWLRSPDFISAPPPLVLPVRVIARGFILDGAFHTVGWGLLLLGVPFIRAERRRRRGLCVGCGYDICSLPAETACPECGRRRSIGHHAPSDT